MYTIASLLDVDSEIGIKGLWHILEEKCSLRGIKLTPLPHITWLASQDYQVDEVESFLETFTSHHKPFEIRTSGLGLFTGDRITLYLALVHSTRLTQLHKELWTRLKRPGLANYYYAPDYWVPHITLANKDVDQANISCAIGELAGKSMNFNINIPSIAILYDNQGEIGVKSIYNFGGPKNNII